MTFKKTLSGKYINLERVDYFSIDPLGCDFILSAHMPECYPFPMATFKTLEEAQAHLDRIMIYWGNE